MKTKKFTFIFILLLGLIFLLTFITAKLINVPENIVVRVQL